MLLTLLLLAGCNPPLRGGIYSLVLTGIPEDSCGLAEDVEGYEDEGSVWWEDRETLVLLTEDGEQWWHWDGDALTLAEEETEVWADDCEALWSEDYEGTIVDPTHFTFEDAVTLDLAGACEGFDTSMVPCTARLEISAERVADSVE